MKHILTLFIALLCATTSMAQSKQEILDAATRANDYFVKIWPDPTTPTFFKRMRPSSLWTRGVYYEGLMGLYSIDRQQRYFDYTRQWADFHQWTPRYGTKTVHADDQCCMQTYLDMYAMCGRKDAYMIDSVRVNMEKQMASGKYDYWWWIDAIQMAMPAYSKMYRITGDKRYMDYAMKCYLWTRNKCGDKGMFNKKEGLWWRDKDFDPPYKESDGKNCYWSRGNGWVYAALARVMGDLKAAGIDLRKGEYKVLYQDYMAMSAALIKCQRADGYWNVSLVSPATFGGPETSGTALFLYGMSWGMREGILPSATYSAPASKACRAVIAAVQPNGFLSYLQGTGKEPKDGQPVNTTHIPDFEDYGAGCVLLGLSEYYKLK